MTERHIMIVMATPVPGEEAFFEEAYAQHIKDILETPGVVAGQRYWASDVAPNLMTPNWMAEASPYKDAPIAFTHLAIYEIEGPIPDSFKSMEHSKLDGINPPELGEFGWAKQSMDYGEVVSWIYTQHGPRIESPA